MSEMNVTELRKLLAETSETLSYLSERDSAYRFFVAQVRSLEVEIIKVCKECEQRGYDAFVQLWAELGHGPTATQCPAQFMAPDSEERAHYLKGWVRAGNELKN